MKGNNMWKFIVVILVVGILTYLAFAGLTINGVKYIKSAYDIRTGIDIRGGVSAKLYPPDTLKRKPTSDELDTVVSLINHRLDRKGILDKNVVADKVNGIVIVDIPWKANETNYDPDALINETIQMAKLTFWEVVPDAKGKYTEEGTNSTYNRVGDKPILEGIDVKDASVQTDNTTGNVGVTLDLKSSGVDKFAAATTRLAPTRGQIGIFMDESLISAPSVNEPITNGSASITGNFDAKTAGDLADKIRSGNLPYQLVARQVNNISPTLGQNALEVSVYAMIVALILVWLFMLLYYRLPGMLANIALLGHTVLQLLFISWTGITITLPGIAGIILTIGMGVDANVIIFERIKEELRNGKTLRAAIDVGFRRAFSAVFDANMTTLIAAAVLFKFGSGPIQSFAITLGLGVILSFVTAVTASRIMLKSAADLDIAKHHWLYGVKTGKNDVKEARV